MNYLEFKTEQEFKEANGYTIDGAWYPRVTKIIGIKSKPALLRYYGDAVSFKAAKEATELAALEGTAVHEAVQKTLIQVI